MNLKDTLSRGLRNLPGLFTGRAQGVDRSSALLVAIAGAVLIGCLAASLLLV